MKNPETLIEDHFCRRIVELGGFTRKYKSPSSRGAPDRIVFFHGIWFVEFKTPTGKLSKLQELEFAAMAKHGVHVLIIDSKMKAMQTIDLMVCQ